MNWKIIVRRLKPAVEKRRQSAALRKSGWEQNRRLVPGLEGLNQTQLDQLNAILPWQCFTIGGSL